MTTSNDASWIDQLIAVGKDFGFDIPTPPPPRRAPDPAPPPADHGTGRSQPRTLVQTTRSLTREELAEALADLAARVREGSVTLRPGGYSVAVDVPGEVQGDLVVRVAEQGAGTEMTIDVQARWRTADGGTDRPAHL